MRPVAAILSALGRAVRRNLGSFGSLKVNNFFLFTALMVYGALVSGVMPVSAYPFLLLLATLMLLPLSADPLALIPASRRGVWPLGAGERIALRLASLLFSPVSWIAFGIVVRTARPGTAILFSALAVGVRGLALPASQPFRWIPRGPGRIGELVRKQARDMFLVLDTYVAIAIAVSAVAWRLLDANAPPEARPILAIVIALALSTQAQCLFGLDGASGATRSRLLPLPAWQILAAKDLAWLSVLVLLTVPFDPLAGVTFGLAALAIGRYPALRRRIPLERWRFAGGELRFGVAQVAAGVALTMGESSGGPTFLALSSALYALSLWLGGKYLFHDTVVRN
jgi:hypothetical protein